MNFKLSKTIQQAVLHLCYWLFVFIFFNVFFSVSSENESFIFWFSTFLSIIAIVTSYVFVYKIIPNYLLLKKYRTFVLYSFYTLVLTTCAVLMTMVFGFVFFYNLEFQQMPGLTKNAGVILVCVFLIVALTSTFKILKYNSKSQEEKNALETKYLQTQLQLKEQELKFLKMQIHPHFLFNTLNTLYGFALKKSDKTPELILKLSNLLDYILYQIDKKSVFLKDELTHIYDYIALEESRFSDSLVVNFHVDNYDENLRISPMLLLPFVENSFKHGSKVDSKLSVNINLSIVEEKLMFTIENTYQLQKNEKPGIGLDNIKKRLELLYKNNYKLSILEEETFKIILEINLLNE